MIKKVIFFVSSPLSKRDYKRFGIEILRNDGFEVNIFDFSPIVYPSIYQYQKKTFSHKIQKEGIIFHNLKEGYQAILALNSECFGICLLNYAKETFWIYRALSKTNVPYAIFQMGGIPSSIRKGSKIEHFLSRISKITLPKLFFFIKNYIFRPAYAKYFRIRSPNIFLAGGESSLNSPYVALIGENTEILWAHTLDYDIYLDNFNNTKSQTIANCNKAVFIDPGGPQFSGDELLSGRKCILSKENYYPSLCTFFDVIENKLGVSVEIAANPQSDHKDRPDYFGQRLTLHDKTFQMIMQSKVVITHASTAINFAVLLKKPVIFITTDELEADTVFSYSANISRMASSLGKKPINIDHNLDSVNFNRELLIDEICYKKYKTAFIKKEGSEDLPSWQIVANRLKKW